ncbi:MAG: hypothetical protein ABGX26_01000 [Nautiliaceae bacterium]
MNQDYEDRMLEAFIQTPKKFKWYKEAFSKFNINGIKRVAWVWSWWAFFGGGFWYLLYRKAYLAAVLSFIIVVVLNAILPFWGPMAFYILMGGYSVYFVYKKYLSLKSKIESKIEDEEKRIETMRILGGYNRWVIWVAGVIYSILFLLFVALLVNNS